MGLYPGVLKTGGRGLKVGFYGIKLNIIIILLSHCKQGRSQKFWLGGGVPTDTVADLTLCHFGGET